MSVLIGRDRELNTLKQALHAASQGIPSCVFITGEAGIGKSRLIEELKHEAAFQKFLILQGNCFAQDSTFPYSLWTDALRSFLAAKSQMETSKLLGAFAPELVKLIPELSLILPSIKATPLLNPAAEKHRLSESLARFATSLAIANPLLIILEDLHWSDESSVELLHFFVHRISAHPILLVGTYRGKEISPLLSHHLASLMRERSVEEIRLAPLTRDEIGQMMSAILATKHRNANLLDDLVRFTEGNPFFIEEVLKGLTNKAGNHDRLQIPHSIQDSVQYQVEQLHEGTRHILLHAAVIGDRFDFRLLQQITGQDEQSLLQLLKELIAAQWIVEQTADQFAFCHTLMCEAVYATLMQRERKVIHQAIGETMVRLAGAQTDPVAAQLAYHFHQAGDWQKVLEYSQAAGERAQALYAPREALVHFTYALEAAEQLKIPIPFSLLNCRAQTYEVLGEFDRARADYEAALELTNPETNRIDEWQSLINLGLLWQSHNLERAGEYYQRALELARNLEDESVLAQTLNRLGNWHFNHGQTRQALSYHREALALFQERADRRGMAQTLDFLGITSHQLGVVGQGASYLEHAVPIFKELDDRQGLVNTLTNLTMRALTETEVLGEVTYQQLTNLSDEALQVADSFNWYQGEVLALMQGAISLARAGEYGQALDRLARAQAMAEEGGNRESFARIHLIFGQIFIELIDLTEAKQHFETGLTYLQELGSALLILAAKVHLATVAISQSDVAGAHALLDDLFTVEYPEDQEQFSLRKCWSAYAELELVQGNPQRALEIVERLLANTPNLAKYGPHAVPHLSRLRAQALAALGRMAEAEVELQGTLPVALKHGQHPLLWRLHIDLGSVYRAMKRHDEAEREFLSAQRIIQNLENKIPQGELRDNFRKRALATIPAAPMFTQLQITKKEFGGLTARERQIAVLIARGKSNREIADELVISEKTAERHVANILLKLKFNSRTQIGVWATEKKLSK